MEDEPLDNLGSVDTLLRIKVCRRLVDEVNVGGDSQSKTNGDTLELSTGERLDVLVDDVVELHGLDDVRLELGKEEGTLDPLDEKHANGSLELAG